MATVTAVEQQFRSQLKSIGKAGLAALFPADFNFFSLSFELVDGSGKTVDYFLFPVNPDEVREFSPELTRVRKTITGVSVTKNPTFNPTIIRIQGDFGKRFKLIINGQQLEFAGISIDGNFLKSITTSVKNLTRTAPQFSSFAKTGYGCVKVLERLKERSKQLDANGKPHSLYLYNPILGNNYLVEFVTFEHNQTMARNTIPRYAIQLTAIAPLDTLLSRGANLKSALKNLTFGALQKTANALANNVRGISKGLKLR